MLLVIGMLLTKKIEAIYLQITDKKIINDHKLITIKLRNYQSNANK